MMDKVPSNEIPSADDSTGSSDSMEPEDRGRAINEAMQEYFGSKEWVKARNKQFPGPARQYWMKPTSG